MRTTENLAAGSVAGCLLLMALTSQVLWLIPAIPFLILAAVCQKVRSK